MAGRWLFCRQSKLGHCSIDRGKDEQPITASSTGKPPIRHLACLVGAWPGRVRRGSSDLNLLTHDSISEDIDPNLHTPTKDTVIPFADPNPMTPPSPPAMHLGRPLGALVCPAWACMLALVGGRFKSSQVVPVLSNWIATLCAVTLTAAIPI